MRLSLFVLFTIAGLQIWPQCGVEAKCEWIVDQRVQCQLKILDFRRNSSSAAMQVPDPGLDHVNDLKIQCSDVFFFESQLRSDHFGSLHNLENLQINYCKLRSLPPRTFVGLRSLKNLVIQTHNEDWTSLEMSPDYESLIGLERLQTLDMKLNNIQKVPPGFLCPLKNLNHIDFSDNAISDLAHLGLSHGKSTPKAFRCTIPVQNLSLKKNGLVTVTPGALGALSASLKHLDLSFNKVNVLVASTFEGLANLETIDLSNNQLAAIPPNIFAYNSKLRTLMLANNTLGTIDLQVFQNLSNLQTLNMSGNNLDENWIRPGIFSGLHNLVVLDLSSNQISRLDESLFDKLTSLQVLNIGFNKIHSIATQSFINLANLHILILQHNRLETIQTDTLTGLSLLSVLNVDKNRLHTLHSSSLKNCTGLQSLSLSHNFLTQVPEAVHHLSNLEILDLSSNLLGVLKRESLQGLPKLKSLKLGDNEISRLGEGTFVEVANLQELHLNKNRFMSLEQDALENLKDLERLDLSQNQLEDVNGLFSHQSSLIWLNLSSNQLQWFDYAFIPSSLELLDIHCNNIDSLGNYYAIRDNRNLKFVNASVNQISTINVLSILPGIVEINLSNNTIHKIAPNTFLGKTNLARVHLERNRLEALDESSLMVSLGPNDEPPQFFMSGNPLVCNCHLQWFHQMASAQLHHPGLMSSTSMTSMTSMNQLYPQIMDLDQITCRVLNTTNPNLQFTHSMTQLVKEDFLCPYTTHCLALCLCCDFLACDCQMKCPEECQCFHDQLWTANVVQCSSKKLTDVPSLVPMDVTSLHLSGNNLTQLSQNMFLGRSRLKEILVKQSNVFEIENGTFSGLDHLEIIDLSFNHLKELLGHEFIGAVSLRELFLEHNQLVTISKNTFKSLKQLTVLKLDGNLLIDFPIWELSSNKFLNSLTLSSNWWECECTFVRKFRMFIDTLGNSVVKDANEIACNTDHDHHRQGQSNCHSVLPNHHIYITDTSHGLGDQLVPVVLGIIGLCVVLIMIVFGILCFKNGCRIWLHSRYGIRIEVKKWNYHRKKEDPQVPMLFDALVIYSNKDSDTFINVLCQTLEPTYRLCLLHRDLSGIYTSEAFKSALIASQRHIVVLSSAFIATEWQHVQELVLNYKKLIILKVENLEESISEPGQQKFLQSSSKVLKWSSDANSGFWKKLKYFLPDPPRLPTKEGGAELDTSGIWTYNDVVTSNSPIRRKVRCSAHSINDSGIYDATSMQTRSCGTNVVDNGQHQRSRSALVETINGGLQGPHQRSKSLYLQNDQVLTTPTQPIPNRSAHYSGAAAAILRTPKSAVRLNPDMKSCNDLTPPVPPPKVGKLKRIAPPIEESNYSSPSSMLMQLAAFSPDLLDSLNATTTTSLGMSSVESSPQVRMMSPVVKAKARSQGAYNHQKSHSVIDQSPMNFSVKPKDIMNRQEASPIHQRSRSMLDPSLVNLNPNLKRTNSNVQVQVQPLYQKKTPQQRILSQNHSRSISLLDEQKLQTSAIRLEDLSSRKILHMSTSQLQQMIRSVPDGAAGSSHHKRSSSTPYEGFVL